MIIRIAAVLLIAGCAAIFLEGRRAPPAANLAPPVFGHGNIRVYPSVAATSIAQELDRQISAYSDAHGRVPSVDRFWEEVGSPPIFNPMNGSAQVVAMQADMSDASDVGWIYDAQAGAVYPGRQFVSSPATEPSDD